MILRRVEVSVASDLHSHVILHYVNSRLIEQVLLLPIRELLCGYLYLQERDRREVAAAREQLELEYLAPNQYLRALLLEHLDKGLRLPRAQPADEAQQDVHVVVLHQQIQVNAYIVDALDSHFFEGVLELGLVEHLLEAVEVQVQDLVLLHDEAPQVEYLVHGVLFKAGEAHCLLQDRVEAFKQLGAHVRVGEELGHLEAAPNDKSLLLALIILVSGLIPRSI